MTRARIAATALASALAMAGAAPQAGREGMKETTTKLEAELVSKYGESERARIRGGLAQAADFWRDEDGNAGAFEEVARTYFAGDKETREALFSRMEFALESLRRPHERDRPRLSPPVGPRPRDRSIPSTRCSPATIPAPHFVDDFFRNRLAFAVLLNFPLTTLAERLPRGRGAGRGGSGPRRGWRTVSPSASPPRSTWRSRKAAAESAQYIAEYNIWMHHLVDEKGRRLFPPKMRLLSHWNLRDQLKADYGDAARRASPSSGRSPKVMERIVTQTIPRAVVNNPGLDWNPYDERRRRRGREGLGARRP